MQGDSPKALSKDIVLFSQQQYYSILTAGDFPTLALNLMHFPIKFLTALGQVLWDRLKLSINLGTELLLGR